MRYLPISIDVQSAPVLVVGGGEVALRKVRLLLDAGAEVHVVAQEFHPDFAALEAGGRIRRQQGGFTPDLIGRQRLVIAATDDPAVNRAVSAAAQAAGIWVNVADATEMSTLIFPAIVDRHPLTVAIGSDGGAPTLVRLLRERLESLLPQSLGQLAELASHRRGEVKAALPNITARRRFWERCFHGTVAQRIAAGKPREAEAAFRELLRNPEREAESGEVYLVGAGPGDPELLTLKALQLMQQADVIVHDGLVTEAILKLARRDALRISVAKMPGRHSVPQEETNELLIGLARQGKRVCRLKGGDPFIYGRGGEECEALRRARVPFRVVPGVTAAAGCAAYAGIPLTHREHAQTVQLVTAHCREAGDEPDWRSLALSRQTLVVYMGLIRADRLASQLIAHGRAATTPVAIIENGTLPQQRVVTGELAELAQLAKTHQIASPALIIIGEVAALRHRLRWFQER